MFYDYASFPPPCLFLAAEEETSPSLALKEVHEHCVVPEYFSHVFSIFTEIFLFRTKFSTVFRDASKPMCVYETSISQFVETRQLLSVVTLFLIVLEILTGETNGFSH